MGAPRAAGLAPTRSRHDPFAHGRVQVQHAPPQCDHRFGILCNRLAVLVLAREIVEDRFFSFLCLASCEPSTHRRIVIWPSGASEALTAFSNYASLMVLIVRACSISIQRLKGSSHGCATVCSIPLAPILMCKAA